MKKFFVFLFAVMCLQTNSAQSENVREKLRLNEGWKFALGNAADPVKDFGCGTEYFNYFTKANSIHNEGPYAAKFNDSTWQEVRIPHDWVCTLPYSLAWIQDRGLQISRNQCGMVS